MIVIVLLIVEIPCAIIILNWVCHLVYRKLEEKPLLSRAWKTEPEWERFIESMFSPVISINSFGIGMFIYSFSVIFVLTPLMHSHTQNPPLIRNVKRGRKKMLSESKSIEFSLFPFFQSVVCIVCFFHIISCHSFIDECCAYFTPFLLIFFCLCIIVY